MQGGDEHQLALAREVRLLETRERRLQSLGAQLEVGLLLEDLLHERSQRRLRARSTPRTAGVDADAQEVAIEPVEALEQPHRLGMGWEPLDRCLPFGDELARERPVAVEGSLSSPAPRPAGAQIEGNLRSRRDLGAQVVGSLVHELAQSGLQLA